MEKHEIRAFQIDEKQRKNLPIFYNYITYNALSNLDEFYVPRFSDKLTCYVSDSNPSKLISKIIDFSKTENLDS